MSPAQEVRNFHSNTAFGVVVLVHIVGEVSGMGDEGVPGFGIREGYCCVLDSFSMFLSDTCAF